MFVSNSATQLLHSVGPNSFGHEDGTMNIGRVYLWFEEDANVLTILITQYAI